MKTIYKAVNKTTGAVYIGQTDNLRRRMNEHRRHAQKDGGLFHEAIIKEGFDNFEFSEIETVEDSIADAEERKFIQEARNTLPKDKVYNICKGGLGGQTHDVTGANNPMYGKVVSAEHRQHLHNMLVGRKKPDGFGARVSSALTGKPKSPEAVAKRSDIITLKNVHTGEIVTFKSKSEAERVVGYNHHNAMHSKSKISKGYIQV